MVFSIDLIIILLAGVMGEFASRKGLKLSTAFNIRFATVALVLMRPPRPFNVAVTNRASLSSLALCPFRSKRPVRTCGFLAICPALYRASRALQLRGSAVSIWDDLVVLAQARSRSALVAIHVSAYITTCV